MLYLSTHFSQAKLIQVAQEFFLVWFGLFLWLLVASILSHISSNLYMIIATTELLDSEQLQLLQCFSWSFGEKIEEKQILVYWKLFLSFHLTLVKE